MLINFEQVQNWSQYSFPTRVDAFNFPEFKTALLRIGADHQFLALDMSGVQFLNYQGIREIHDLATSMKSRGGALAFVGASERLKRQFRLFASLDPIRVYSTFEWRQLVNTTVSGRA